MTVPLYQAKSLLCERDDRLLFEDLSFNISPGDIVHIEGPNGSGKTTLLRILAGLFTSYEGDLLWREEDVRYNRSLFNSELLFLGHKPAVKRNLSPIENLTALSAHTHHCSENAMFDALAEVGLAGYEHVPCAHLSAGQHRRVSLARLYLSQAPLWILDEMFTAIDKGGVAKLEQLLEEEAGKGRAIILTTHHPLAIDSARVISLGQQNQGVAH